MGELEDKVERMEKLLLLTWKLAKAVKRAHNQITRTFNGNFDVFDENVKRNSSNIDKIVITLQELVGDAAKYDKEHPEGNVENKEIERMFL